MGSPRMSSDVALTPERSTGTTSGKRSRGRQRLLGPGLGRHGGVERPRSGEPRRSEEDDPDQPRQAHGSGVVEHHHDRNEAHSHERQLHPVAQRLRVEEGQGLCGQEQQALEGPVLHLALEAVGQAQGGRQEEGQPEEAGRVEPKCLGVGADGEAEEEKRRGPEDEDGGQLHASAPLQQHLLAQGRGELSHCPAPCGSATVASPPSRVRSAARPSQDTRPASSTSAWSQSAAPRSRR